MFVRRLLVSAVLACLSACATVPTNSASKPEPNQKINHPQSTTSIGGVNALNHQSLPQRAENPHSVTASLHSVADTSACLRQKLLQEFKLPTEFVNHKVYTDNNQTVGLINPFTQTEGITMDVVNQGGRSEIKLYGNGNLLSRAWQQLPSKCGQGKTTTVATVTPPTRAPNPMVITSLQPVQQAPAVVIQTQPRQAAVAAVPATPKPNTPTSSTAYSAALPDLSQSRPEVVMATAPLINQAATTYLTQDDMNIVAPLTAAMVAAPLAAKLSNQTSNRQAVAPSNNRVAVPQRSATQTTVATPVRQASATRAAVATPRAAVASNTKTTATKKTTTTSKTKTSAQATAAKKSKTKSNSSKAIVENKKLTRAQKAAAAKNNQANTNKTAQKSTKSTSKNTNAQNQKASANKATKKTTTQQQLNQKNKKNTAQNKASNQKSNVKAQANKKNNNVKQNVSNNTKKATNNSKQTKNTNKTTQKKTNQSQNKKTN